MQLITVMTLQYLYGALYILEIPVIRNTHLDSWVVWVYRHADCCRESSIREKPLEWNPLNSQNPHMKFQLLV